MFRTHSKKTTHKIATAFLASMVLATSASAFNFSSITNILLSNGMTFTNNYTSEHEGNYLNGDSYVKTEPGQVTYCFNRSVGLFGHQVNFGWSGTFGIKKGISQDMYGENNYGTGANVSFGEPVSCPNNGGNGGVGS